MTLRDRLLGSWELTDFTEGPLGNPPDRHPFGERPEGSLVYTADGGVFVQIAARDRARFRSDDYEQGTNDEHVAQAKSYLAYVGRFEIEEAASVITHILRFSLFPNWTGGHQRREITLTERGLVLQTAPFVRRDGLTVVDRLHWKKQEEKT